MSDGPKTDNEVVEDVLNGNDRFYAPIEVARMFGLEQSTIQRLCRQHAFPNAKKVGTMWKIPGSDIRNYIKNGPAGGKSE